jgi:hypothetical protein
MAYVPFCARLDCNLLVVIWAKNISNKRKRKMKRIFFARHIFPECLDVYAIVQQMWANVPELLRYAHISNLFILILVATVGI